MAQKYTREQLVARLVRAGEIEVTGEDIETIGDYFAPGFEFNGPGGFVADFNGLSDYFASVRAGFDDRSIRRGIVVVEGNIVACQTWIEGTFVRESSPRLDTTDASEFCDPTFDTQVAKAAGLQITNPLAADAARP
jgi:hypothetical protein